MEFQTIRAKSRKNEERNKSFLELSDTYNLLIKNSDVGDILEKVLNGKRISKKEALELFYTADIVSIGCVADFLRKVKCGDVVTFIVNRNINFTNICRNNCKFCAYKRKKGENGAYTLTISEIVKKAKEAEKHGATEVCIQGGINSDLGFEYYLEILRRIKAETKLHIHAFSPMEIRYISEKFGYGIRETLKILKENGLDSMPGTAAEILVDSVREKICPEKISTKEWIKIIETAHEIGIPTTATIMYGHIETYEDVAEHLNIIRNIQDRTGKFTEFVPLSFIHKNTELYKKYYIQGSSGIYDIKIHAISRIFLDNFRNIQVSWVKLGKKFAQVILDYGANDFGGTLMEENISKAAGASEKLLRKEEIENIIRGAGRIPKQRDTLYNVLT